MKTRRIIVLFLVLCLAVLALTACKATKKLDKAQTQSQKDATQLDCVATVTDGDTVVYKYEKNFAVVDTKIAITTKESKINTYFVLETTETFREEDFDRANFAQLNFKDIKFKAKNKKGTYTGSISSEALDKLLGVSINAAGDVEVVAHISSKRLDDISFTFTTVSGKSVILEYKYTF